MHKALLILCAALVLTPMGAAAQDDHSQETKTPAGQATTPQLAVPPPKPVVPDRFIRTLTNVQVELTLSDQIGTQAPEKKTVSMIVSSGNWGKIRSAGTVRPVGDPPFSVELNVDARPFVSIEGQIQLEMTLVYSPPAADARETLKTRPTGMNQSLTVVLQSGKPLVISQAADPVSDRKVIVEVKATVLK